MSIEEFAAEPWKKSHAAYDSSVFNIRPAPEFATAEVILASVYRAVGLESVPEQSVPQAGRELDRLSQRHKPPHGVSATVEPETWRTILHGVLESPKQPKQSAKRFLQLCPVVPDVARYSGSARLAGNSWNPGALVQKMIRIGAESELHARTLWGRLFASLSVEADDDVWAKWLQGEFEEWRRGAKPWELVGLAETSNIPDLEKASLEYPARRFVRDLDAMISAKTLMTRRQWLSLMEAILRLGAVTHVLWLCDVNDRIWKVVKGVLESGNVPSPGEIRKQVLSASEPYLAYGSPAVLTMRDFASRYLIARLGINLILWHLEEAGQEIKNLSSSQDLAVFADAISKARSSILGNSFNEQMSDLKDREAKTIGCKKGIGSNMVEFGRHALGQRQVADEKLRGYDQGYIIRKKSEYRSSPFVVSLGPVAVIALVHCCLSEAGGPRSIEKLCQHLGLYGLDVDRDDVGKSDLGKQLRMLGLVLDSPDAESGMLLVPPFALRRN